MKLSMHTNGSAREQNWWKELAKYRVIVTFGIDGLEDTHHLYRISTDFNKIIDNAQGVYRRRWLCPNGICWSLNTTNIQVQEAKQKRRIRF